MKRYFRLLEEAFIACLDQCAKGNQKAGCLFFLLAGLYLVFAFWGSWTNLIGAGAYLFLSYYALTR